MQLSIVVLDAYSFNPGDIDWSPLAAQGRLTVYEQSAPEQIHERIRLADAVITNRCRLGEAEFAAAERLRYVGLAATGYDKIDLAAARNRGIAVCNVPGYSTEAVAQFTFALLLDLCAHARQYDAEVRAGRWRQAPGDCIWLYPETALYKKTFGVVGTGAIGCAVGRIARAFGMRVIGFSRSRRAAFDGEYVSFDELLETSDVVSLHCPASAETRGIIGREELARMKPGAILLNTARGALVDAQALADALNEGRLFAAAADVFETEPITPNNPLFLAKNCLLTPHVAWTPLETRQNLMQVLAENLGAFLEGKIINRVDLEV